MPSLKSWIPLLYYYSVYCNFVGFANAMLCLPVQLLTLFTLIFVQTNVNYPIHSRISLNLEEEQFVAWVLRV